MNMKKLNHSSPIPLYRQLADEILHSVRSGSYKPGEKIPSETILAENFGIGRPTVRQATELLIRKGILKRIRGSGTFVKEEQKDIDLFSIAGTSSAFNKKGIKIKLEVLKEIIKIKISENVKNPFYNKECYFFSRLSTVCKEPLIIEDFYLDADIFKGLEKYDLEENSLSGIVEEKYFLKPVSSRQNFRIGYADKKKAGKLKIEQTFPLLVVERFLNFPNAENAVYSEIYCKTDKFVFSQTIFTENWRRK